MRHHLRALVVTALVSLLVAGDPRPARAAVLEYSGEATVIGGTLLGLISAEVLQAETTGVGNQSTSNATIANVVLTIGLITIEATLLEADATATCTGNTPSVSGT